MYQGISTCNNLGAIGDSILHNIENYYAFSKGN